MKNAFVETYKAVKTLATRIEAATTEEEKNSIRKECEDDHFQSPVPLVLFLLFS